MSRLLLDTTFLIDAGRRGSVPDGLIEDEDDVAIAAITVAELRVGALLATRRHRGAREAYVDDVLATIPALPYDTAVAEEHARLLMEVRTRGTPRGAHDLLIAATARASDRTIISADANAFDGLPGVSVRDHR